MSKAKTKRGPMDTLATQDADGYWNWTTSGYRWRYAQAELTLNLFQATPTGPFQRTIHVASLNDAIMYSWGVEYGLQLAAIAAKQALTEA